MPYLIQRRVRTRQPQQAVGINSDFNGSRVWIPGSPEASGQSNGILTNNAVSQLGLAGKLNNATAEKFELNSSAGFIPTSGGYTLVVSMMYGPTLGTGQGVGPRVTGDPLSLRATPYMGSSGSISWDYGGATEGVTRCSATVPTSDGTIASYVFTTGPRGMEIWSNGNKVASNAANPTRSDTSAYIYAVGDIYGGSSGTESYALIASIPFQLSSDRSQSLSGNPWQIFEDEEEYLWVPDAGAGTTSVSSDDAESYLVRSAALATDSEAYAIRGVVYLDSACAFTIRTEAQASSAVSYNVKAEAQASATSGYNVLGEVQGSSTAAYSVRSVVYGDSSPSYNVGLVAVSDGVATYTIRASVVKDSAVAFNINSSALSDNSALFNIKALVSSDSASAYSIRTSAQQEVASAYLILNAGAVAASSSANYNILGVASAQGGEAYNIRASAISSGVVGYSIRGEVGSQATSSYTVDSALLAVFASSACAYSVLSDGVWPLASDVRRGINYGPTGNDYTGTLSVGTGSGGGMNVTLSEPRLIVVSRDNSVYVIHKTQRKIFS